MTQRDQDPRDYEEQSYYGQEVDYEIDASELCRKPKEASKPRDLHIIVDTSDAVAAEEGSMPLAKIAVRSLLKALSPDERIELSTSNEHGERVLRRMPVEDVDEVEFENKLDGLRTGGVSHLFDNLLQRLAELDDLGDREVTLVVLAGSMDEDWASSGILEELSREVARRPKLRFVFLGINLPVDAATELGRLCQPYRHATFTELKKPAAQIEELFSSRVSAKHALEIDIRRPCPAATIGRAVDFFVVIRNNSDTPIPSGSRLYLNPNGYFRSSFVELPEIATDMVHGEVLRAFPKGRVSLFDLEERCEVAIQTRDKQPIANQPFFLDMVDFIGELGNKRHFMKGRLLNLYVIGAQGSGKGSFINTLLTLLSDGDSVIMAGADVGGGAGHQTDRLTAFNIGKTMRSTRLPKFPFRIFDTWGMDKDNYKNAELGTMLRGLLPVGWHMEENAGKLMEEMTRLNATAHQREAHAVFFFISFSQVEDEDHASVLKEHFRTVKKLGFNPMVVLARIDEEEPAIRDDPLNWDLPKVARLRRKLADMLSVGLANVLVSVPYVTQDSLERNFKIEKLAYHNLRCGLDAAIHYLMTSTPDKKGGRVSYEEEEDDDDDEDEEGYAEEDRSGGYADEAAGGGGGGRDAHGRSVGEEADFGVQSFVSDETGSVSSVASSAASSARRHRGGGGWHHHDPYRMMPPPPPHAHQHYYGYGHYRGGHGYRPPTSPYHVHGPYRGGRHHHHHHGHHPPPPHMTAGGTDPHLPADRMPPPPGRQQNAEQEEPAFAPPTGGAAAHKAAQPSRGTDLTHEEFRAHYFEPKPEASSSS